LQEEIILIEGDPWTQKATGYRTHMEELVRKELELFHCDRCAQGHMYM
jgi:hypothetical protein